MRHACRSVRHARTVIASPDPGPILKRRLILRAVMAIALGLSLWLIADRMVEQVRTEQG
ncbi:hypothetical protein [Jannaschia donghaensis]|uniref:Uncharacterized protein n=1 Tax=Jannaschia donghaensis TaxID=420998 RepID=A0A0M6YII0_9RHOB|nr:hypothetical protein [Jannaschia donghaensis]CTQ49323.1 hypothetical protein JDO7802_01336 [Jannaschia donghaensis]